MIPLLSRDAVRDLDRDAVDRLGLPSLVLMENAGRGAFEVIAARFPNALERVLIVAGPGQNGGDGFVVARHLLQAGAAPLVILIGAASRLRGDAAINFAVMKQLEIEHVELSGEGDAGSDAASLATLDAALDEAAVVIDALFGTGLDRPIVGLQAAVIEKLNASGKAIVALDLPSGIDADTGRVLGVAIQARVTVIFAAHKRGLHQHPGAAHAGELVLASIGIPIPESVVESSAGLLEARDIAASVAPRARDAHKGTEGHVLLIAGGPGRTGAALLAGLGALRGGAGLVTLATRASARAALEHKVIELMTEELPEQFERAIATVHTLAKGKSVVVIGPGLGLDADSNALARALALELALPCVLDADALTAFSKDCHLIARATSAGHARVLTPHPGEAARMLGVGSGDVQADRFAAAEQLAQRTGAVVVLKGARTIIAAPTRPPRVCPTGTPAMAVGGTGDVLAGVLGALLGQLPAFEAACAAVYLHGLAGELASTGDRGLLASELAAHLPAALVACRAGAHA